ncbi:MAG: hypothetical protein R3F43_18600 [bacterium]
MSGGDDDLEDFDGPSRTTRRSWARPSTSARWPGPPRPASPSTSASGAASSAGR